ncbi:MAG: radical SAM protein [Bacteroides sp.]|nr:radical SAM protein [Bacteroides sp.]
MKTLSIPCHLYMLYLNEKGEIYPCPRSPKNNIIGYIYERNIIDKILYYTPTECCCTIGKLRSANQEEVEQGILNTNLEIGGECNGACTYCFQKTLSTFRKHYPYFPELHTFYTKLNHLQTSTIFGGEVTIQPETLHLISSLKKLHNTKVSIVTNGAVPQTQYRFLCDIISSFQVSFNGFSETSFKFISGIKFEVVKAFCEYLSNSNKNLDVKMILSPMVIHELIPFLTWAVHLNVKHIMVYYAILPSDNYEDIGCRDNSSLSELNPAYWQPIIKNITTELTLFFTKNKQYIITNKINIIFNNKLFNFFGIKETFLTELDIPQEKSISISCKAWKKKLNHE